MRTFPFLGLLTGFTLWSAAFLLLYAVQATGCKLGWQDVPLGPTSLLRIVLSGVLLFALVLFYLMTRRHLHPDDEATDEDRDSIQRISRLVNLAAAVSTLVTFAGVFWLMLC